MRRKRGKKGPSRVSHCSSGIKCRNTRTPLGSFPSTHASLLLCNSHTSASSGEKKMQEGSVPAHSPINTWQFNRLQTPYRCWFVNPSIFIPTNFQEHSEWQVSIPISTASKQKQLPHQLWPTREINRASQFRLQTKCSVFPLSKQADQFSIQRHNSMKWHKQVTTLILKREVTEGQRLIRSMTEPYQPIWQLLHLLLPQFISNTTMAFCH